MPVDSLNPNRVLPGQPLGSLTERLAWHITELRLDPLSADRFFESSVTVDRARHDRIRQFTIMPATSGLMKASRPRAADITAWIKTRSPRRTGCPLAPSACSYLCLETVEP